MRDHTSVDETRDLPLTRSFPIRNNMIHISTGGQYGFWTVSIEKGQLPQRLKGSYTSFRDAEKDVRNYYETTGKV